MEDFTVDNLALKELQSNEIKNSREFAQKHNLDQVAFEKTLKSLNSLSYISLKAVTLDGWKLSEKGEESITNGTPEYQVLQAIPEEGISQADLDAKFGKPFMKFAFANGMKKKFFALDKETKLVKRNAQLNSSDPDVDNLLKLKDGATLEKAVAENLKKREFILKDNITYYEVTKGEKYLPERVLQQNEVTSEMIKSKNWADQEFKQYNWNAQGKEVESGNLHPLQKVRNQFKEVLAEMGFEEMPTNNYIESCFWNFDTLFVPQKHPARDLQDTFYISDPAKGKIVEREYFEAVKKVHEKGDFGSIGYQYDFQEEESQKLVFRTHTTAASARMLYKIAQEAKEQGEFQPRKFYSIDRVFRNEQLDATHLAEFHQIEGIIADKEVGLGHLMGVIEKFFNKIGIHQLMFKPTYNPYTEPSLEIYGYHPILKKMVEIGNSGVFRPEMLRPMGIPEDVQVLGWGLGLERPTMIQYGYSNIRELFGDKVDLKMVKKNPITCFQ